MVDAEESYRVIFAYTCPILVVKLYLVFRVGKGDGVRPSPIADGGEVRVAGSGVAVAVPVPVPLPVSEESCPDDGSLCSTSKLSYNSLQWRSTAGWNPQKRFEFQLQGSGTFLRISEIVKRPCSFC